MGKCVVIGNGVTGRAAAHAARKMHNEVDIYGTLGTRDASTGSSRVLRCDYGSVKMSNHATIVYSVWISLYPQLVILCGRIIIYPPEQRYILTAIDRTRVKLGKGECPTMTAKEAQDAIGAKVDFERKFRKGTIYVLVKEDCVLDWNGFMDLMGQPQDGIVSRDEEVTGLDIGFGKVTRVRTKTGSFALKQNDTVILASGGRTEDNMERWVVPKLPESHQPFAVVIISYEVKLGDEELAKVKDMRIISVIGSCKVFFCEPEWHIKLIPR
jgi:hypothetical protein